MSDGVRSMRASPLTDTHHRRDQSSSQPWNSKTAPGSAFRLLSRFNSRERFGVPSTGMKKRGASTAKTQGTGWGEPSGQTRAQRGGAHGRNLLDYGLLVHGVSWRTAGTVLVPGLLAIWDAGASTPLWTAEFPVRKAVPLRPFWHRRCSVMTIALGLGR
jgi:hypothetical protein